MLSSLRRNTCQHITRQSSLIQYQAIKCIVSRNLSSTTNSKTDEEPIKGKQPFVNVRFEPGEWDMDHKDPLHRPPWKSKARILSKDDFANQPRCGMRTAYRSLRDAMFVPSWLFAREREGIYNMYLRLMEEMEKGGGATSHEYAVQVVAQKFNISKDRAAAVIQLSHNEEQMRKNGEELFDEAQEYADSKAREAIDDLYRQFREPNPYQFVEDPDIVPKERSREIFAVDELWDMKDALKNARKRERDYAQKILDEKIYIEDTDPSKENVKVFAQAEKLMKTANTFHEETTKRTQAPLPAGGERTHRPRSKFVAKLIDTREYNDIRKHKIKHKRIRKSDDVILEENGKLRPATVAEVESTSLKRKRNVQEFIYGGVKQAWLEKTRGGVGDAWGRMEAPIEESAKEIKNEN